MRALCAVALTLFWLLPYAAAQDNPTFADVLREHSIAFPPASIPHLNAKITSFDILDDEQEFVIAYYLDNPKDPDCALTCL